MDLPVMRQEFAAPPELAYDTSGASRALANAKLWESLATVIAGTPEKITNAYEEGRRMGNRRKVEADFEKAKAGTTPALSDFSVSDGNVSYRPEDPIMRDARAAYYMNRGTTTGSDALKDASLYEREAAALSSQGFKNVPATSQGARGTVGGSVFGLVPDGQGGWMHDPNDKTDAHKKGFSPTQGKYINPATGQPYNIKDPNLEGVAVSPAQLRQLGVDWNDQKAVANLEVVVTTANGQRKVLPIVDALGTEGRLDFTPKAYSALGGPTNRGGGIIPGLSYQIVPKGSFVAEPNPPMPPVPGAAPQASVDMQRTSQDIDAIAKQVGGALASTPPQNLTASTSGAAPSDVQPPEMPVAVPTVGVKNGIIYRRPTGPDSMEKLGSGDKAFEKTPPWVREGEIAPKPTTTDNAVDRAIIQRGGNPVNMTPEQKTDFLQRQVPLKPSEKIAATRDLRASYQELPTTIALFGKGQMPGIDTIKEKLDAIHNRVGGDFKKMTDQEQRTFIFQMSKLNDPNSAVLLSEYKAAADTLGIGDRIGLALNKMMTGQQITPEQAKEIYDVVRITHEQLKKNYLEDIPDVLEEAEVLGIPPRRLNIPAKVEKWLKGESEEAPKEEAATPAPGAAKPQPQVTFNDKVV